MKIIDISPELSENTAVWPGDIPLKRTCQLEISKGDNLTLSSLNSTVHIGAHADAPSHYCDGKSIEQVSLEPYIGQAFVVDISGEKVVEPGHCVNAVELGFKRILFKTAVSFDHSRFSEQFCYFLTDSLEYMGKNGVTLIGIDTPSVDKFDSKDLSSHQILKKFNMANLEGLDLSQVSEGEYELIALPLKLKGFDASPVRAVLRS